MQNNPDSQPFFLYRCKIEPFEANQHPINNDKDLQITKLQYDLVQERELNKKYTNEIASLTVKIESHKEEEKRLLKTIEEYKTEIDLLSTNLNSFQSLSDNFVKAQQEFIAFNKKCSNNVHKIKLNLNRIDTNLLPSTELSNITNDSIKIELDVEANVSLLNTTESGNHLIINEILNEREKSTHSQNDLTNNELDVEDNNPLFNATHSRTNIELNSKQNQESRVVIETVDDSSGGDSTDQLLETNINDSSPNEETNSTDDEYLEETESDDEMSEAQNEFNEKTNLKIRPIMVQKEKEKIDLPFSLMAEFSSIPIGYITNKNLNEKQKLAITRLQIHARIIFLREFNRKTSLHRIYKSKLAYRLEMRCIKHCKFYWKVLFYFKGKKVSVFKIGTMCDHFVDLNGIDLRQASHITTQASHSRSKFIIEFLNTDIWKSIQKTADIKLAKFNLTNLQLDEFNRIEIFLKELLLYKYKIRTTYSNICKTKDGFSLYLQCLGKLCKKRIRIFFDISTKESEIFIKEFCEHVIQSDESNAENEIKIYKEDTLAIIASIKEGE